MIGYVEVAIISYLIGIIAWPWLWRVPEGFSLLSQLTLLYFPFILTPLVLMLQIIFILWEPGISDFHTEENLVAAIETNNSQLVTATFGVLVLAATLASFNFIKSISRTFLLYMSLSLIASIGGVLMLYWLPLTHAEAYFVLRHLKTIPYTYSIGFLLTGTLIIIQEVLEGSEKLK